MKEFKVYPKPDGEDYTPKEIRNGLHLVNTDIVCEHCGKTMPIASTQYMGGPCYFCGKNTTK